MSVLWRAGPETLGRVQMRQLPQGADGKIFALTSIHLVIVHTHTQEYGVQ